MTGPHQAHFMAADALHAERLATAARHRFAATQLAPRSGTPRVQFHGRRLVAALTSLVMAALLATAVSAAVNTNEAAPSAPNAAAGAGQAGGGATHIR